MPDQNERNRVWEAITSVIAQLTALTQHRQVQWAYDDSHESFTLRHRGVEYALDQPQKVGGYLLLVDGVPVWRGHGLLELLQAVQETVPDVRSVIYGPEPLDYRAPAALKKALAHLP